MGLSLLLLNKNSQAMEETIDPCEQANQCFASMINVIRTVKNKYPSKHKNHIGAQQMIDHLQGDMAGIYLLMTYLNGGDYGKNKMENEIEEKYLPAYRQFYENRAKTYPYIRPDLAVKPEGISEEEYQESIKQRCHQMMDEGIQTFSPFFNNIRKNLPRKCQVNG